MRKNCVQSTPSFLQRVPHFLTVTDLPNIPRPRSSMRTTGTSRTPSLDDDDDFEHTPLPTRSVGSLVDAFPSVSSLALTMRSSFVHQYTTSLRSRSMPPSSPPDPMDDDDDDDDDDAPS